MTEDIQWNVLSRIYCHYCYRTADKPGMFYQCDYCARLFPFRRFVCGVCYKIHWKKYKCRSNMEEIHHAISFGRVKI
jgi:hypothetical protein